MPTVSVSVRPEDATGPDVFNMQFQLLANRGWQRSPILHIKTRGAEQTSKVYEDFPGGEMWGRRALQEATREAEVQPGDHDLYCTSRSNNILLQPPNTCLCHLSPSVRLRSWMKLFGLSGISVWDSPWEQAAPNINFHNRRWISDSALWPRHRALTLQGPNDDHGFDIVTFQVPRRRLLEDMHPLPCIKSPFQW